MTIAFAGEYCLFACAVSGRGSRPAAAVSDSDAPPLRASSTESDSSTGPTMQQLGAWVDSVVLDAGITAPLGDTPGEATREASNEYLSFDSDASVLILRDGGRQRAVVLTSWPTYRLRVDNTARDDAARHENRLRIKYAAREAEACVPRGMSGVAVEVTLLFREDGTVKRVSARSRDLDAISIACLKKVFGNLRLEPQGVVVLPDGPEVTWEFRLR